MVKLKKNYYSKTHDAMNPPPNTLPHFQHTYGILFATFWSSSGSSLSCFAKCHSIKERLVKTLWGVTLPRYSVDLESCGVF